MLLVCLGACGGNGELAAFSGKYELIGHGMDGYVLEADDMTSEVTLRSGGTGRMSINDTKGSVSSWSVEEDPGRHPGP